MNYDFITIGGATEDITMNTNEGVLLNNKKDITRQKLLAFEFGAKIKIEKTLSTYGGGAANTAVNFSRLGFKTLSLVSVGDDDRGKKVVNNLLKQGVDISAIQKHKGKETGFSFNLVGPGNEHIIFSSRGTNGLLQISGKEISKLTNTKWIYITSLSGEWEKSLKKIFSVRKVKFAWNPGSRQIKLGFKVLKNYFAKTDILCVNKDEAIELAISDPRYKNKTAAFLNNIRNLEKILKSWGPKIVVVTSGKKGADVYDGECFYHQNILKEKKRINTLGVGDAFSSSFIAGLELYKNDIKKSMRLGLKSTASVVAHEGAQTGLLTRKDI